MKQREKKVGEDVTKVYGFGLGPDLLKTAKKKEAALRGGGHEGEGGTDSHAPLASASRKGGDANGGKRRRTAPTYTGRKMQRAPWKGKLGWFQELQTPPLGGEEKSSHEIFAVGGNGGGGEQ